MKADTKIKILGWIMIVWGLLGLLRRVFLPIILIPLGIGILLKNNISRIITKYLAFLDFCMAILGFISLFFAVLIPRIVMKSQNISSEPKARILGLLMMAIFIIMGFLGFYIWKFLDREEIKKEFIKQK
jgi:hypothetical protein